MSWLICWTSERQNAYPVLLRVVLDGTVGAELAHLGRRADALLDPLGAVLVRLIDKRECLDVCGTSTVSETVSKEQLDASSQESKSSVRR